MSEFIDFERITRIALRFETPAGLLSTEDLWNLPLKHPTKVSLDNIALELHRNLKTEPASFVDDGPVKENLDDLRFAVVKHIIGVRVAELAAKREEQEIRERVARLDQIIAEKQDAGLREKSVDELQAERESLLKA